MSEKNPKSDKPLLVMVTGLSGAGKSVAINALEDIGFYCIDNLPSRLVDPIIELIDEKKNERRLFAIGMDVRDQDFINDFPSITKKLSEVAKLDVLFLNADDEALVTRFSATRRKHPLLDVGGELLASIRRERDLLRPVEDASDVGFDSTRLNPHQLARMVEQRYEGKAPQRRLHVTITSFGFKYGALRDADNIYDVRFLPNPHFVESLRDKTGLDSKVRDYVMEQESAQDFFARLLDFQCFLLPQYYNEGKHYFRVGIGCTGGKHRSVAIAERLGQELSQAQLPNIILSVHHRDLAMTGAA